MRRALIPTFFSLALLIGPLLALAQNNSAPSSAAKKIDEYRISDVSRSHDEQMRLWSSYDEFAKEPKTSRLFIIGYSSLPGGARRYAERAKNLIVAQHNVAPARIGVMDGGYRIDPSLTIWIVPEGARDPVGEPQCAFRSPNNAAWKYDEFPLYGWWLTWGRSHEGEGGRLDGAASLLKAHPNLKARLVVYRGAQECELCLERGSELRFAAKQKDYLVGQHKISPARIAVVSGGYVEGGKLELWLIPASHKK